MRNQSVMTRMLGRRLCVSRADGPAAGGLRAD